MKSTIVYFFILPAATRRIRLRPGEVRQPRSHVLKTQMLHLNVGRSEALYALLQELKGQVRLIGRKTFTHALDEDGVVRRNTQTCKHVCTTAGRTGHATHLPVLDAFDNANIFLFYTLGITVPSGREW